MVKKNESLHVKIDDFKRYLMTNHSCSNNTIQNYNTGCTMLKIFTQEQSTGKDGIDAIDDFLTFKFGRRLVTELSKSENVLYNTMIRLKTFIEHGKVDFQPRSKKKEYKFKGPMGEIILSYLNHRKSDELLAAKTVKNYEKCLFHFAEYSNNKGLQNFTEINLAFILNFTRDMVNMSKGLTMQMMIVLRGLLRFLFDNNYVTIDFSAKVPKYSVVRQSTLPTVYSVKEIKKILLTFNRANRLGKRDYVITLILTRYGLRPSDIVNLTFENLDWNASVLRIKQRKTGHPLELPLLPDVGNAIIDYLKHRRTNLESEHIFLAERPPYGRISSATSIGAMILRAIRKSGLKILNKGGGPRSLRQSLATRMLNEHVAISTISEVLGHKSSESARHYLRIDLTSMKQCVLEVPTIDSDFYRTIIHSLSLGYAR